MGLIHLYSATSTSFDGNGTPLVTAREAVVKRDEGFQLTFSIPISQNELHKRVQKEMIVSAMTPDGVNYFRIWDIEKRTTDVKVTALQLLYSLDVKRVNPFGGKRYTGTTVLQAFVNSFKSPISPYTFSSSINTSRDFYTNEKDDTSTSHNALAVLNKITDNWSGELLLNGFDVRMISKLGTKTDALLYEHKNIASFSDSSSMNGIITRIYATATYTPERAEGAKEDPEPVVLTATVDSPLIDQYAVVYEATMEYNDARTVAELRTEILKQYSEFNVDKPERTIDVETNIVDGTAINFGDELVLKYLVHDVDEVIRCVGYEYDPISENYIGVTLGTLEKTFLTKVTEGISSAVTSQIDKINEQIQIVQTSANGKNRVTYGPNPVPNPIEGDLWFHYPEGRPDEITLLIYQNGQWIPAPFLTDQDKTQFEQKMSDIYEDALAEIELRNDEYKKIFDAYDDKVEALDQEISDAGTKADSALEEAGISTDLAQTAKDLADTAKADAQAAISNAQSAIGDASKALTASQNAELQVGAAMSDASKALTASQNAELQAGAAISDAGQAISSANAALANAKTALTASQNAELHVGTALSDAGQAIASANTAKTNAQTALDDAKAAIATAGSADSKAGQAILKANAIPTTITNIIAGKNLVNGNYVDTKVNDATGAWSQELVRVEGVIDGLEIGGRNYFIDHLMLDIDNYERIGSYYYYTINNLSPEEVYTASVRENFTNDITIGSGANRALRINNDKTGSLGVDIIDVRASNGIRTYEREVRANEDGQLFIVSYIPSLLDEIHNMIQIEKGNKATDWTPAPEDLYSQEEFKLFNAQYTQDVTGMTGRLTTVENTKLDGSTFQTFKEAEYQVTADKVASTVTRVDTAEGKITTQGTAISQQATTIASKADKTVVDRLSGTVSSQGTLITQNATAIKSKAESSLVDTIKGTVDTHTTEISQNATDIASKASSTSVNTLSGTVSEHTTKISQNAKAIEARLTTAQVNSLVDGKGLVTANYVNNQIKATADGIRADLTNVEGKIPQNYTEENLVQNSKEYISNKEYMIKEYTLTKQLVVGKEYTIVLDGGIGSTGSDQQFGIYFDNGGSFQESLVNIAGGIYKKTFTLVQSGANSGDKSKFRLYNLPQRGAPAVIKWIKLVEGKAKDNNHTPTMSDMLMENDFKVFKGEYKITSEELSSRLTAIDKVGGRLSTAETQISQNATDIESKAEKIDVDAVKGTVATHTTKISQNATAIESKASSTSVDTLTGTVGEHSTTLTQHATAIEARLTTAQVNSLVDGKGLATATYVNNQIKATADGIKADLTKVEGKIPQNYTEENLVQNSKVYVSNNDYMIREYALSKQLEVGKEYTIVLEGGIGSNGTNQLFGIYFDNGGSNQGTLQIQGGGIYKKTFTLIQNGTNSGDKSKFRLYNIPNPNTSPNSVIKWIKLVEGKAKDNNHTPSMSDMLMENDFTVFKSEYEITAEKLSSRLSAVDKVGGRLSTAETQISQNASAISARLTTSQVNSLVDGKGFATANYVNNQIKATADGINAEMTKVEGKIPQSYTEENLVLNSKVYTHNQDYMIREYTLSKQLEVGKEYTIVLSGSIGSNGSDQLFGIYFDGSQSSQGTLQALGGEIYKKTFTLLQTGADSGDKSKFRVYNIPNPNTNRNSVIKWIKLVEGKAKDNIHRPSLNELLMENDFTVFKSEYKITSEELSSRLTAIDKVGGRLSTAESSISQNAKAIEARLTTAQVNSLVDGKGLVTANYVDNQITTTANGIKSEISRVEGKIPQNYTEENLVLNSKVYVSNQDYMIREYALSKQLEVGKEYTIVLDGGIGTNGTNQLFGIYFDNGGSNQGTLQIQGGGIYKKTFTLVQTGADSGDKSKFRVYNIPNPNTNRNSVIRWIKLVEGSVTDNNHTPSMSDLLLQNDFTVFKNTTENTIKAINTELSKTAKTTDLKGMVTESVLSTKNFVTAGTMTTTLSSYAQTDNVPTKNQFNTLKNSYDSLVQTIGTNGNKIARMVMTDSLFRTEVIKNVPSAIGGRNYVLKSNDYYYTSNYKVAEYVLSTIPKGTKIKISLWGGLGSTVRTFGVYVNNSSGTASGNSQIIELTKLDGVFGQGAASPLAKWTAEATLNVDAKKILIFGLDNNNSSPKRIEYIQIEVGNYYTDWAAAPEDKADQSQVTQLAGSWALSLKSGGDVKTQINATTDGIRLQSKLIHLSGETLIDDATIKSAHIYDLNARKITGTEADFVTLKSKIITAESITSDLIKSGEGWIDKIFSDEGKIDYLWNKEMWSQKINAITIDAGRITGETADFISAGFKAVNSQATLNGHAIRIQNSAGEFVEMNNTPELRSDDAGGTAVVLGKGRVHFYDSRGYSKGYVGCDIHTAGSYDFGTFLSKGSGIYKFARMADATQTTYAYYTVKAGITSPSGIITNMVQNGYLPDGNAQQFVAKGNMLSQLNGWPNYPNWPTLKAGQQIRYKELSSQTTGDAYQDIWRIGPSTTGDWRTYFVQPVTFARGFVDNSDRRLKYDIANSEIEALSHIESLTLKSFKWKDDNRYEPIGLIAQDSGILRVNNDEYEGINTLRAVMLGLKGVQELQEIVKEQAEEIKRLKEIINQ